MVRLGTIGSGWIVEAFLDGTKYVDGLQLAAVYSRGEERARKFAEKVGAPATFTDLRQMAQSDMIDAVYIASPNSLHVEQSRLFLEHGKHVICEKTVAPTRAQTEELVELAKSRGLVFLEAIVTMHLPGLGLLESAVEKIGPVRLARFDISQYSSKYPAYLRGELPNIFNPQFCTGSLMDMGVYCVYPAIRLFGAPKRIHASASFLESGADVAGSAIFEYDGFGAVITHCKAGSTGLGSEIIGENGTITIDSISTLQGITLRRPDGSREALTGEDTREHIMSFEARSFLEAIENPAANRERVEELNTLACEVSGAMEAIRRQAGIRFPSDDWE